MAELPLLGKSFRKANPKLRMIANGRTEVNLVRSELSSSVRVPKIPPKEKAEITAETMLHFAAEEVKKSRPMAKPSDDVQASVFIERAVGSDTQKKSFGDKNVTPEELVELGNLATGSVPLSELESILDDPDVTRVELGEPLTEPTPLIVSDSVGGPLSSDRQFNTSGGRGVLIGIIDVQGFDFAHADFLINGGTETRFERIWDQGGDSRPAPSQSGAAGKELNYGSEIRKEHMDAAIAAEATFGVAAQLLEPQSQTAAGSHGTHVASIAAGNRGVCHNAFLAGVLVSLPREDTERRKSFYDSTRIAHAVKYLFELAEELRVEHGLDHVPVSINISLGTNGHAHDGSSAVSRWIDSALTTPGRAVCVAAGNSGQEKAKEPGDIGFIMGRIHTSGRIPARGLAADIEWLVAGNTVVDFSENELEIWYSPADRVKISVRPPGGDWVGPISPGQFTENRQLEDGSFLSIYNELYHPANGANYIAVFLSPFFSDDAVKGIRAGQWTIRLEGEEVRDGRYHAWIERDDPRRIGAIGSKQAWRFPSFFSNNSNVDKSSVSSLGCGHNVLCIANLDGETEKINISSSQGPTRDNRFKPDVAAPGTDIVAANGFAFDEANQWIQMTGTSMASPYVAGVVGLMLAENPKLTAMQISGIIQRTSRPLPGDDFNWRDDAGYGRIDPSACLAEVDVLGNRSEVQ